MIFTAKNKELAIFGNTLDDIKNKIDKFNEIKIKNGLFGENGAFASLFSGKKINNILTPEVLSQFEEFKEKFNSSSLSVEVLAEEMENVDQRIIDYAKTCKNGEMSTKGFKASVEGMTFSAKAGKAALSALATVGNMIAMWAVSKGLELAAKGIDNLIHRTDKLREAALSSIADLDDIKSKADSLNQEFQTISNGISELEEKPSLTFIEQEELEKLKDASEELKRQIDLHETLLSVQEGKTRESALEYLNAKDSYEQYGEWDTSQIDNGNAHYGQRLPGNFFEGTQLEIIEQQLKDYENLLSRKENVESRITDFKIANPDETKYTLKQKDALLNLEMELQSYDNALGNLNNSLYETIPNLESYKNVLNPDYDQSYIDFINNLIDSYDKLLGNSSDTTTDKFNDIWTSNDFSKHKAELESLAKAGKLDASVLESNKEYQQLLEATGKSAEETAEHINALVSEISSDSPTGAGLKWDYSTTLQNLGVIKETLSVLDQSYTKLSTAGGPLGFDELSAIHTAFSNVEGIDNYIQRMQEAGQNTGEVTAVIEELIGAYLNYSGVLTHVTDENKNLIVSALEELGILNAEDLVLAQLNQQAEMLAIQKQFAAEKGYEFADASLAEAAALLGETDAVSVAEQQLAQLALEKIHLNSQSIDTSADIENVIALANAAQASAEVIAQLTKVKTIMAYDERTGMGFTLGDEYKNALAIMKQLENGTYNFHFKPINPEIYKAPKNTSTYTGGGGSGRPVSQTGNAAKAASWEAVDAINAQIDALEREKKAAQEAYQSQIDDLDDLIKGKQKQIDAINEEADAIREASQARKRDIDLQKAQYDLARAENQRVTLVYSEDRGLQYTVDTTGIRDKREKVRDIQEELEIARLQKQADLIKDEIHALEEKKDAVKDLMEESNKYYEGLIQDLQETAREAQKTTQEMEKTLGAASSLRSLNSGRAGYPASYESSEEGEEGELYGQSTLGESVHALSASIAEIPDSQENIYNLSEAFTSLGEAIKGVSDALGIGEEGSVGGLVKALSSIDEISLSGEEGGIISQFLNLKTAVEAVSAAVAGGGSTGLEGGSKDKGVPGTSKTEKGKGGSGSLTDSIEKLRETTDQALGSGEEGGSGEGEGIIGKFTTLKKAVDAVTNAIGLDSEDPDGENLIGAILAQSEAANVALPQEKLLFEDLHGSIELCVRALKDMIAALNEIQSLGGPGGGSSSLSKAKHGRAYANGYNGLPNAVKNALRSEYGQPELTVYPNGKTELTTQPVMSDLPKGTVVYNARQTEEILKGKTKAASLSRGIVLSNGQSVVPYASQKAVSPLSGLGLISPPPDLPKGTERVTSAIQQISVRNTQPVVHNTIHMSLPNVTNHSGVEYIEKELGHLSQRALQEPLRKY